MLFVRQMLFFVLLAGLMLQGGLKAQFGERKRHRRQQEKEQDPSYRAKWTLDPDNEDPEWRRAHELYKNGRYDETLVLFKSFLAKSPREVSVAVSMAGIYWDRGQYKLAEQWYDKALKMVPGHVEARKWKARMFFQLGRFKESEQLFKELLQIPALRTDIQSASQLNLGKICLVERRFNEASKWFMKAVHSRRKGHRTQGHKGLLMVARLRRTRMWNREQTANLRIFFSPEVAAAGDASRRKSWARTRQQAFERINKLLGLSFKEPLSLYVFKDDGDAYEYTGQDLPTWKYSWWTMATTWRGDPGYDMALMMVARVRGFRPPSKPMVTGLAAYAAGLPEPHKAARRLFREGRLKGFAAVHVHQSYSIQEGLLYGQSFVAWLSDNFGLQKFLTTFAEFKLVLLDARFRSAATGRIDWPRLLSAAFQRGLGASLPECEQRWHAFLAR